MRYSFPHSSTCHILTRPLSTGLLLIALLCPCLLRSQTAGDPYILDQARIQTSEKVTWKVFGKVTDLKGQPVRGASVAADIGLGPKYAKQLTTDVQGEFETQYEMLAA